MLSGFAAISWFVPERHWEEIARVFTRINGENRGRSRADLIGQIASVVGEKNISLAPDACLKARISNKYLERMQLMRCYRPGGWHPRVRFRGREHIDAALSAGRGAVLWVAPFSFSDTVTKIAFHREGFAVSHLSRVTHNLSDTLFGERALNPIRTTIECRYLAERVVIGAEPGGSSAARARLVERLGENRLVSITVGGLARRTVTVPFMGRALKLPTAPLVLALNSSAPLLPVFTVREADGGFATTINPALNLTSESSLDETLRNALMDYVTLSESYVNRYPDQYPWHYVETQPGGSSARPPPTV